MSSDGQAAGRALALSARGLGKSYTLLQNTVRHDTLGESLTHRLRNPLHRPTRETFWALQDVDFDIYEGDVVGVIGRNGAGKSTLLKILSRITVPTTGQIDLYGRVGSLLEVGTGFHPELTGRENIYLNGAILGMTRREINRQFAAIVEFAEVTQFLDTPVKRYSSGMYVRLAFAVAAHLNPEILIVDEVLAVGDAAFQRKCLGKMQDVARSEGRTVLFVSHNMAAVRTLCNRAILLKNGRVLMDGDTDSVVAQYVREGDDSESFIAWEADDPNAVSADGEFRFVRAYLLNDQDEKAPVFDCRRPFSLVVEYAVAAPLHQMRLGFTLQTVEGVTICGSNDSVWPQAMRPPGHYTSRCTFPGYILNEGSYLFSIGADIPNDRILQAVSSCLTLSMEDVEGYGPSAQKVPGILRPRLDWQVSVEETMSAHTDVAGLAAASPRR